MEYDPSIKYRERRYRKNEGKIDLQEEREIENQGRIG
jgi:hypothetical protein